MQSKNQQDTKPRMLMFITFKSINSMCHIMEISSDEWEGWKKVRKTENPILLQQKHQQNLRRDRP